MMIYIAYLLMALLLIVGISFSLLIVVEIIYIVGLLLSEFFIWWVELK